MKQLIYLLLALLSTFSLNAQNDGEEATSDYVGGSESNWKELRTNNFSISYPGNWKLDESGQYGTVFFLFSPAGSGADHFIENVNLIKQDLKGMSMTMANYVALSTEQIKSMIMDAKIVSSESKKANGKSYHRIHYSGRQEQLYLDFVQYYFIEKEVAYVLTFSAETSAFKAFEEQATQILDSFQLLK